MVLRKRPHCTASCMVFLYLFWYVWETSETSFSTTRLKSCHSTFTCKTGQFGRNIVICFMLFKNLKSWIFLQKFWRQENYQMPQKYLQFKCSILQHWVRLFLRKQPRPHPSKSDRFWLLSRSAGTEFAVFSSKAGFRMAGIEFPHSSFLDIRKINQEATKYKCCKCCTFSHFLRSNTISFRINVITKKRLLE